MRLQVILLLSVLVSGVLEAARQSATAAEWDPQAFAQKETLQLRTVGPEEGEYWFPVWLVVIDDQVYVRLGSRAANRVKKNATAPYVGVKIAEQQFARVKGEEAPEMADAVAQAMAKKYWSDLLIRFLPHPLTLRLIPEEQK
ncbi:MAG TPA: hypothetical protein VNN62_26310 [Methylomirabilota bacterium]|jgi:hypothetical protein|nr:hypothetical protein [Methylomirabilota bacterium]